MNTGMKTAALQVTALCVASLTCASALSSLAPRPTVRNFAPAPSVGLRGGAPKLTDEQASDAAAPDPTVSSDLDVGDLSR